MPRLPVPALLLLLPAAWGVEGPLFDPPRPPREPRPEAFRQPAQPAAPAPPQAIEFTWDQYRSVVVIGDGSGQVRPAWVATYEKPVIPETATGILVPVIGMFGYRDEPTAPKLAVAYRAQAWLDAQGRLHIDAKSAVIAGPQAEQWSPDSFLFTPPDRVETADDNDSANHGVVDRVVTPAADAETYRRLQLQVMAVVGDGI